MKSMLTRGRNAVPGRYRLAALALLTLGFGGSVSMPAQRKQRLNGHRVVLDAQGKLLS